MWLTHCKKIVPQIFRCNSFSRNQRPNWTRCKLGFFYSEVSRPTFLCNISWRSNRHCDFNPKDKTPSECNSTMFKFVRLELLRTASTVWFLWPWNTVVDRRKVTRMDVAVPVWSNKHYSSFRIPHPLHTRHFPQGPSHMEEKSRTASWSSS